MPASDDECQDAHLKGRSGGIGMAKARGRTSKPPKLKPPPQDVVKIRPPGFLDNVQKAARAGVICRHCKNCRINRPKGLCWGCYYAPGVREMYASTSRYARRGVGNFAGEAPLADTPTLATPGTPEKVTVMEQRAKDQRAIFHPADARFEGDPVTLDWLAEYARRGFTLAEARAA